MDEFRNIVFEGGGVKGIAYGGALEELDRKGILKRIRRVAGTSAGAINAALLALDYSAVEVSEIISNTDFNDFADDDFFVIRDIWRFFSRYGWHKGKSFRKWAGNLIEKKTGKADLTFHGLHILAGEGRAKDLYVIGTNLSAQAAEIYSHEKTPDMEIRDALRISMSIPFYFQAARKGDDVMTDGGVTQNYPINIFDNARYVEDKRNAESVEYNKSRGYVFNHETLGFRLDSRDEIEYERKGWLNVPEDVHNIKGFAMSIKNFLMESANKRHLHKNDWNRTIFIDTLGVKTTDFDISRKMTKALIESGREGVKNHFRWRDKAMSRP